MQAHNICPSVYLLRTVDQLHTVLLCKGPSCIVQVSIVGYDFSMETAGDSNQLSGNVTKANKAQQFAV